MAFYNLGYIYQDRGNIEASIECFLKATKIQPNDADSYINLGLALKQSGRINEAINAYNQAINVDETCAMAHFNLGNAYQEIKDYDNAIHHFQTTLQLQINHTDAMFNLAISYQDRAFQMKEPNIDDLKLALQLYMNVHQILPNNVESKKAILYIQNSLKEL